MSVYDLQSIAGTLTRSAVTIGMFDGVHLGHRTLLQALRDEAARIHGQSVVLTFDRHPAALLRPDKAPKLITSVQQRVSALEATGVDAVVVAAFDRNLAELSAREFFERILVERLKAASVVVGHDFRFGKGRAGDFQLLARLGMERGVASLAVSPALVDEAPVSSTRIRTLLRHGAVEDAARLLGRPFVLEGQVIHGDGLGRRLGFPTANMQIDPELLVPGPGVYVADVVVSEQVFYGVVSIGTRPTVEGKAQAIEVFIMDFARDIYGENIRVGFRKRLREQRKFADLDELAKQIRKDVDTARVVLLSGASYRD